MFELTIDSEIFLVFRIEGEAYVQYKAMMITLALHLLLLMFELLVCDNLESNRHFWILVFVPLIFISIISIAVCIWAVKNDRSFDVRFLLILLAMQMIDRSTSNNILFFFGGYLDGIVLLSQHSTVYIFITEAGWLHKMGMGNCFCAIMDHIMCFPSWGSLQYYFCWYIITCTRNKSRAKEKFHKLCNKLHVPSYPHPYISSKFILIVITFSFQ